MNGSVANQYTGSWPSAPSVHATNREMGGRRATAIAIAKATNYSITHHPHYGLHDRPDREPPALGADHIPLKSSDDRRTLVRLRDTRRWTKAMAPMNSKYTNILTQSNFGGMSDYDTLNPPRNIYATALRDDI